MATKKDRDPKQLIFAIFLLVFGAYLVVTSFSIGDSVEEDDQEETQTAALEEDQDGDKKDLRY